MSRPRQTTLFHSWRSSSDKDPKPSGSTAAGTTIAGPSRSTSVDQFGDDEEDEDLLLAMELSLAESRSQAESRRQDGAGQPWDGAGPSNAVPSGLFTAVTGKSGNPRPTMVSTNTATRPTATNTSQKTCNPSSLGLFKKSQPKQGTLFKYTGNPPGGGNKFTPQEDVMVLDEEEEPEELTEEQLSALENIPGFDKGAGQIWIYPTNFPLRDYQFSIVRAALFTNTLVVLPTGLGKTFIAAVVMYNFYRWYPQGKVVFMAPTKPLVAQQIEACHNIMGIPQRDSAEMTGAMQPAERKRAWQSRRVFFLTPQVLTNDLTRDACPALHVKCLVVDEAHKALGNHAYCQVVRELAKYEGEFRVLALSATPGSDMKAVQQVITNMMVSHVELRGEESPDIKPYTHERSVEKVVVPLGAELTAVKEKYLRVMTTVINRLKRVGAIYNREVTSFSKFLILKSRESFRQNPPHNLPQQQFGAVEGDFALAISLYHGYDLLQQHGLRSLQSYLLSIVSGEKGYGRTRAELLRNSDFTDMMEAIKKFAPVKSAIPSTQQTQSASQLAAPFEVGHPKMKKLQEIALDHFNNFDGGNDDNQTGSSTRVMIFAQYRDSVNEITEMLNRHRPLIKCMSFIGQSSVGKATKGFTQKEQLKVMRLFREGGYNTLVSTCVGEEGLDIGDVDLIICFDAHKSPIRLVQRMGRTGRKRKGRIIMLVTAGKEEQIYNQSQYSKRSIFKAIQNGAKSLVFYPDSKRMVPDGLQPRCHRMHVTVTEPYQARTKAADKTSGKAADRGPKTSKNSAAGKKSFDGGFLSPEELRYWSQNYKVKDEEVYKLPDSNFISIKTKQPPSAQSAGPHLSLSEWMPWQNRLQSTIHVDHSLRTRHMVDVVEFMQVQIAIGDSEDIYGQEMQMFLNKDDVIVKTNNKPQGLLRYCTPKEGTCGTGLARPTANQEGVKSKRPRRSENLPTFSSGDEDFAGGSDDDLPIFDGEKLSPKKTRTDRSSDGLLQEPADTLLTSDRNNDATDGGRIFEPMEVEEQLPSVSSKGKVKAKTAKAAATRETGPFTDPTDVSASTGPKGKGKGKKSKQKVEAQGCEKKSPKVDDELTAGAPNKKVKKKKRHSSGKTNRSVIALIEDPTDEDFEDVPRGSQYVAPLPEAVASKTTPDKALRDKLPSDTRFDIAQEKPPESPERMLIDSDGDHTKEDGVFPKVGAPAEVHKPDLSQLLPFFTPHKEFLQTTPAETTPIKESSLHRVATPPPLEELQDALEGLACRGRLSPVDVLSLIDKWERDKASPPRSPPLIVQPSTSKGLQQREKVSTACTPVRISSVWGPKTGVPVALVSPSTSQKVVNAAATAAVFNESDFTDDLFFDNSMVVGEPYEKYKDEKGQSDKSVHSTKDQHSKLLSPTIFNDDANQDAGQTSNVSDASSTGAKVPSPVTPFIPSRTLGLGLGSNTSTPVYNTKPSKLDYSPLVSQVLRVKDDKRHHGIPPNPRVGDNRSKGVTADKSNVSLAQDSFYGDFNDSMFAALETPQDTPREVKSSSRPPPAPLSTTQDMLTFTQALACVNDSVSNSRSSHSDCKSPSPVPAPDGRTTGEKAMRGPTPEKMDLVPRQGMEFPREKPKQQLTNVKAPLGKPTNTVATKMPTTTGPTVEEEKEPVTDTTPTDLEDPHFDLGFDFDDFDDEMIIPPSPEASCSTSQGFSQRLRGAERTMSSENSTLGQKSLSDSRKATTLHSARNNLSEKLSKPEGNRSPSMLHPERDNCSVRELKFSDRIKESAAAESAEQTEPTSPPSPTGDQAADGELRVDLTDSLAAIFAADGDSEELFCDEEESDMMQPESHEEEVAFQTCDMEVRRPASPMQEILPAKSDFKTPVKPAPKAQRAGPAKLPIDVGVYEDSPILPRQKRKRAVVTSDEDSPVVVRSRRRIAPVIDLTLAGDDEDDDFVDHRAATKSTSRAQLSSKMKNNSERSRTKPHSSKCRQVSGAAAFLDVEAERSEDNCSEDESDNSDQDQYDNSFINDFSQMSQTQPNPADMRAVYLQSVRSPVRSGGYRFSGGRNPHLDVFSQVPEQDSEYMEDSFVVDGDESEEEVVQAGDGEVTLLEADVTMSRQTRRQARVAAARRADQRRPAPARAPRRRVVRCMDSSSEEEEAMMGVGSMDVTKGPPKVRTALVSTSSSSFNTSTSPRRVSTSEEEVVGRCKKNPPRVLNDSNVSPTGVTQLPSLQQRCRLNMQTAIHPNITQLRQDSHDNNTKGNISINPRNDKLYGSSAKRIGSDSFHPKSISSSIQSQPRKPVLTNISNNNNSTVNNSLKKISAQTDRQLPTGPAAGPPVDEDPSFSLGMDFLDDNWDEEVQAGHVAGTASPALKPAAKGINQVDRGKDRAKLVSESSLSTGRPLSNIASTKVPTTKGPVDSGLTERERRLEFARQRKEEFLRKRNAAPTPTMAAGGPTCHFGSQIHPPTQTPEGDRRRPGNVLNRTIEPTPPQAGASLVTPERSAQRDRMVILVDSREITGAANLMSDLRFKHKVQTVVCQLGSCDYVLSNRMGVDRILLSVFMNGSRKAKLVERVREMCEYYDRPCLIVEQDHVKPGEQKAAKPPSHTKYTDSVMAALAHTHVKLLFSDTQEQTAGLLTELAVQEQKKGQAISASPQLTTAQEQSLRFYLTLPRVSYVVALNLVHGFRHVGDMMRSSQRQIEERGHMSAARALDIRAHLGRLFDPQMLGLRS